MLHSSLLLPPWDTTQRSNFSNNVEQLLSECCRTLATLGVIGVCFSGRPFCGARDWLNTDPGTLFKRSQLLSRNASVAHPGWVNELQAQYLKAGAAQDPNFLRCLQLHAPFLFRLVPGSKTARLFAQHHVASIVHWPVRRYSRPGWCGAFILLFGTPAPTAVLENAELDRYLSRLQLSMLEQNKQQFNPFRQLGAFNPTSLRVLELVAQGLPTKAIAKQIHLSERGVDYHLEALKQKLGANNRVHLIHLAHQFDLV
ncbi:helix-turn-helix transcriptional regulator [Ferrimonas kyonanensis]|uniref:helix-turn-helix transcriptional regulator n=1 Tax=Ferrimonas kyonanensis TaxID=364763 RepID=UPI00047F5E36|nr:LuxR family transcriptional regulator [Ferrimonas kyonanensis]